MEELNRPGNITQNGTCSFPTTFAAWLAVILQQFVSHSSHYNSLQTIEMQLLVECMLFRIPIRLQS